MLDSDDSFALLHRAGWSVGEVQILTEAGPRWLVTGTRAGGENQIRAEGRTQSEAWWNAMLQARAVGMPKP